MIILLMSSNIILSWFKSCFIKNKNKFNNKEIKKIKVNKKCRSAFFPCSHNATIYYKNGEIDRNVQFDLYDAKECFDMLSLRNMFHFKKLGNYEI